MYRMRTFVGAEPDEKVWVHLCNGGRVEIHSVNGATLTREQFAEVVHWIESEFQRLERAPKWVN